MNDSQLERLSKEELERLVCEDLAEHLYPGLNASVVCREPPYPDVVLDLPDGRKIGVEVCALVREDLLEVEQHEEQFLRAINTKIDPKQWPDLHVGLVMQEDRDTVLHKPAPGFESFRVLPKYLDAMIVHQGESPQAGNRVQLNQRSSKRPRNGLFPKKAKEVTRFAQELTQYVSGLEVSDFNIGFPSRPKIHHAVVAQMESKLSTAVGNPPPTALEKKLSGAKKYDATGLDGVYLLVHNKPQDPSRWMTVWNVYWHRRKEILGWVASSVNSTKDSPFDVVYFADYSEIIGSAQMHNLGS